jgi:polyvinyl alcohol dehydrogenase (cytochrome)
MRGLVVSSLAAAIALLLPVAARAACPPSCPVPGGGSAATDCHAEFAGAGLRLNYRPFDPAHPRTRKEVRCFDGDVACDADGMANNLCTFDIDVCLRNPDPALPACTPADVTEVSVARASRDPDLAALNTALNLLLPATTNVCTSGRHLTVALKGPDGLGRFRRAAKRVSLTARTAGGVDTDSVKLTCVPRGWPSHGYDRRNSRATPLETKLGPGLAVALMPKWNIALQAALGTGNNGVSSTPAVGFGLVYIGSWNGFVIAAKQSTGAIRWTYDTQSQGVGLVPGVTGSVTLTADGRALVGDANAVVHCLNAKNGKLLWKTDLREGLGSADQIWGSPTVALNRVFMGVASHSDNPCTNGRLMALDLDTGAILWSHQNVPAKVCTSDTAISCALDFDCPNGGTCVTGRGAGVTATVSTDETGEFVYMNTVGCFTFPSIGDSDSIFKIDAATGADIWKVRVKPSEQFNACAADQSVDCRSSADCAFVGGGACNPKAFYHDFGFLNGPLVVEADDGIGGTRELVVSGSKDGSLYARDPATGAPVWTRVVQPSPVTPAFAGFGLFNGAVGFANDRFFAALFDFVPSIAMPPKHLQAFSAVDGSMAWEDEIGTSFSGVGIANGLVAMGTLAASNLYVYDAATGVRLKTLTLPNVTSAGPSIVDGTMYVGYGLGGSVGGVAAFELPPPY